MTEPLSREIYNPIQRDRVTFIKTSAETGGELTLVELEVSPGGGNPLHFHTTFTEHFMVEEGELGAQLGKRRLLLHVGESRLSNACAALLSLRARVYGATMGPLCFGYTCTSPEPLGRGLRR